MGYSKGHYSVNCCVHCRKNLSLTEDAMGYRKCADCIYFENIGVYSIEQYNDWLRTKKCPEICTEK